MVTNRYCKKCNSPREEEICQKCGEQTFVPCAMWKNPKLPPIDHIRRLAREVGYAIGVHGTLERDLDLIAAPWEDTAVGNQELMEYIAKGLDATIIATELKPLGRYTCTIQMNGYFKPIDLSVCTRIDSKTRVYELGDDETTVVESLDHPMRPILCIDSEGIQLMWRENGEPKSVCYPQPTQEEKPQQNVEKDAVIEAAKNLVKVKGRHHSEQAYLRLVKAVENLTKDQK